MMFNEQEKIKEIETAFEKAVESARAFDKDLMAMRNIELPNLDSLTPEEQTTVARLGRDLDLRTAFILRSILAGHGNVLWM